MRADRSARAFQRRNEPRHTKIAIIHRFWRQLCVMSLPFEIFRRLNALFTTLCVENVAFDCSAASKQSHTQANRNHSSILSKLMRYFSPIEIFRRLNALFTALCVQDVVHDYSATSKQAHTNANRNRSSILTIIMRYFSPVWDISTFQRTSHCMQNAGHAFSIVETGPDTRK